uniref:Uncharacterized protein n=1 Tax=Cannabis sativa TaxID=3483 RepID=A0A803R962_CANSA
MANARIARFITEVAPPQFVTVMRHRTTKVLDTIKEEERDVCGNDSKVAFSSSSASPSTSTSTATSASSRARSCSSSSSSGSMSSKYFLKDVPMFSIFEH